MPRRRISLLAACLALFFATAFTGAPASADTVYHEPYRPQFHFSPQQNWMNDPNGLIYYKGQYHLFFQYNPSGDTWGNMSWGHAVSTDLVHWTQLPLAIPQDDNEMVFSGSVVFDRTDSSGLGTAANPPLVAIYTSAYKAAGKQAQSLAYSLDGGTTWSKYGGNPVLDIGSQNFRDPKVFWYQATRSWLMTVALSDQHKVSFYTSKDLKSWTHLSDFGPAGAVGGAWECPDLFPLPVDGNPADTKWVLVVGTNPGAVAGGSGVQYFVGGFDGTTFTDDDPPYTPPAGVSLQDFDTPGGGSGSGSGSGSGYGDWTATGTAFGTGPAAGTLPGQQSVTGFTPPGLVNSFNGGDASTGELTSPTFTVTKPYLNFLVGGGDHPYVPGAGDGGPPPGTLFQDWSVGTSYADEGWTATGDFASSGPFTEQLPNQLTPRVLDTFSPAGDPGTGTITSPTFTIGTHYIALQVAGGDHPFGAAGPTAVNLLIGGKVVASATGTNSGALDWTDWDVGAYAGRQAQIQVVDSATGGWGHLMVGDIVFSDQKAEPKDDQTSVNLVVGGSVVRSATGSNSENLDWTSWDLRDLVGKQAQIQIVDHDTGGWGHILADDFTAASAPALSVIQRAHWIDYGPDFYASSTFNDTPDGSRIMVGWMNNWQYGQSVPTSPWRSADSLPRRLSLRTIDGHVQLTQQPDSLGALRRSEYSSPAIQLDSGVGLIPADAGSEFEAQATLNPHGARQVGLDIRTGPAGQRTRIGYDATTGRLFVDRTASGDVGFDPTFPSVASAPVALHDGALALHVLVDTSSVEVYTADGTRVLTSQIFPDPTSTGLDAFAEGGRGTVAGLRVWRLGSIWL
ncbi:fructan beta-fructosidase [Catenulispora sp. GAS73]|uniref:GH32 C-terminal domain-containing protein n=1 Tax=Catenulispora sp. GAS73 TaxID=3156269 RepID=UPI003515BDDB